MFNNPFELRDELQNDTKPNSDPFGRLDEDGEPDTEIAEIKNPTKIKSSVGDSGQNSRRDVAKTEQLLGKAGTLDLKKTDGPTGYWGTRTSDATKAFQKQNDLKVDGQINPGGETIRALGKLTGQVVKSVTQQPENKTVIPAKAGTQLNVTPSWIPDQVRDDKGGEGSNTLKLTDEAFSENTRAARYLASRDGIGDFSKFIADGIETDGEKAIAETVDLYRQTAEMNKTQADALIKKVMPGLSSENATRLQLAIMPDEHQHLNRPISLGDQAGIIELAHQQRAKSSELFDRIQGNVEFDDQDTPEITNTPQMDEHGNWFDADGKPIPDPGNDSGIQKAAAPSAALPAMAPGAAEAALAALVAAGVITASQSKDFKKKLEDWATPSSPDNDPEKRKRTRHGQTRISEPPALPNQEAFPADHDNTRGSILTTPPVEKMPGTPPSSPMPMDETNTTFPDQSDDPDINGATLLDMGAPGPRDFMWNKDKRIDFGEIPPEVEKATGGRFPAKPIRVQRGEPGIHQWGKLHVESDPKKPQRIRDLGYENELEMIEDVSSGYEEIYQQENGSLLLVKPNGKNRYGVVRLQKALEGEFYGATTWFPDGKGAPGDYLNGLIRKGRVKKIWP